jgi:hypothetical protein
MASRGLRDLGDGPEKIVDTLELRAVRFAGLRVIMSTLATSAVATSAFVFFH